MVLKEYLLNFQLEPWVMLLLLLNKSPVGLLTVLLGVPLCLSKLFLKVLMLVACFTCSGKAL